eukprot:CAMPEP_0185779720 /NCGR_PEP_ID=MMETSP1174-20130828/96731_1 /TAXON_ID=35687 /ORGANISM="Dictyocha speculum, Strain CCMP1381" /LENGTH=334 /DNA_ID=CAMNT_0028468957 /DNA_START=3 /DNA_END=1007 /DNA_ORIENTATION=+
MTRFRNVAVMSMALHAVAFAPLAIKKKNGLHSPVLEHLFAKVAAPPNFTPPEPKPLTVTSIDQLPSLISGSIALALRLLSSVFVLGWTPRLSLDKPVDNEYSIMLGPFLFRDTSSVLAQATRPAQPPILYEYEGSPFCRKVREVAQVLDLTIEMRPCPGARQGFAAELKGRSGAMTVPYLADPNTGTEMFESEDIIDYLVSTYGPPAESFDSKALWPMRDGPFLLPSATFATLVRGLAGSQRQSNARRDNEEMQSLELWGYEASPFVKPVREKLCALCLPHRVVACSRGSANRDALIARTGRQFQVPFLVDPNTGVEMFESAEIVKYLDAVYTE